MLAHELALCSTIITLQQTQTKFDLKQKKMIVNKRKPWVKNHSPKKNDDNYNDNNLCFCYNATTNIDYD
jgi:hypothetical protein